MKSMLASVSVAIVVLAAGLPALAQGAAADPAGAVIERLDQALADAARAPSRPVRMTALGPTITSTFNLGAMAQFVVGPTWDRFSADDQSAIARALSRYLVARFVHDLADSPNAVFTVDPTVQQRGIDKLVHSRVVSPGEVGDKLDYRMRQSGSEWKVIDVYYNGVSELTTQRADLAAAIATGKASELIAQIDRATTALS